MYVNVIVKGSDYMYKILVADDEKDVVSLLKDFLEMKGYDVLTAYDGIQAIEMSLKKPDLILLDINMPDVNGFDVCKKIREYISCPILFLTARIEDSDKINGFASGGDDYITKPFSLGELEARIAAHIRRENRIASQNNVRLFGNVIINYTEKTVCCNDEKIELTKKEYGIIEMLSVNAGQIFNKEQIYEKIWGYDAEGDSSVVAEHIRRLRAKLTAYGEEQHINTVWGMGYKWIK